MIFVHHSILLVARVSSESAMFLPHMDRFTFMFRCCFAFLCTFSSAQFLFYLYPAQFERDGVLSLWYSSLAFKTLQTTGYPHIQVSVGDGQAGAGISARWRFSDRSRTCRLYHTHGNPNHRLFLFGRYTGRAWNHHGMLHHATVCEPTKIDYLFVVTFA